MGSSLLIDVAAGLHYAFLAFLLVGGYLALLRPRLLWLHVAAAVWAVGILTIGQPCPLTALEDWARGGSDGRGFVDRHVTGVLYPERLEHLVQATVAVVVLGSWVLLLRQRWARSWASSQVLRSIPPP